MRISCGDVAYNIDKYNNIILQSEYLVYCLLSRSKMFFMPTSCLVEAVSAAKGYRNVFLHYKRYITRTLHKLRELKTYWQIFKHLCDALDNYFKCGDFPIEQCC